MTHLYLDGKNYLGGKANYAVLKHAIAKFLPRYIMLILSECFNRLAAVMISHEVPPTAEAFFQLVPVDGFC